MAHFSIFSRELSESVKEGNSNSVAQQPMRNRAYCAHPSIRDHWALRCMGRCPDQMAVAEWYRYRTVACFVTGSSPVPLKTRRVGQRCTLNLSRAKTSSRWCGVVVRRGGCQLRCRPRHLTMVQNYVVRRQKPSCS
ncbi:uncharacterized protein TNCV_52171 [Trichonephila clavipes]|nr:uncharacterized protein TNCV_52171 [Trichonephila clavipes]